MNYYEYYATVVEHGDADTTTFEFDLGFRVFVKDEVRWMGIDAPEKYTELGKISMSVLANLIPVGTRCMVRTFKDGKKPRDKKDKYGRWLAEVWSVDPDDYPILNINQWLVENNFAREYHGEKKTWLSRLLGK